MKTKKVKTKKAIKQSRTLSARQIAASRRIGCPGVIMFKMKDLESAGYNPRLIAAEALEGLMNSISRFGCVEPIVVNTRGGKNVIIGGNQRLKALRSLGITECLCVTVSCSKADEKLLNLTLNNPQIQGDFIKNIVEYIEQLRQELPEADLLNLKINDLQNDLRENQKKALKNCGEYAEETIRRFKKTHILLSFKSEVMVDIQGHLMAIMKNPEVEYEQCSN